MKKSNNFTTVLLIVVLFVGLSLLLYPSVSDYWNSFTQSKAIAGYVEQVADLDEEDHERLWQEACAYNEALGMPAADRLLTDEQYAWYERTLNVSGSGVMAYIEIPSIDCALPVYHTTDDAVLQTAVGHLEWTSLPTGGDGTHCVLSGHRGLPSAKLFTNLDKLVQGDVFMLRVLDEVLTYEVDQILIVEPHETDALLPSAGEDLCTLVTCTPYGVNSHRLLVRGHRIETAQEAQSVRVTSDAVQIEPLIVAPILAAPILLVLVLIVLFPKSSKRKEGGDTDDGV